MTTPAFATAKEAREARWHSRRHETAESRHEAFRYCLGGKPQTRKDRQLSALARHEAALARYEDMLTIEPENWGNESNPVGYCEYKIRVTKRTIAAAKKKLGIEEEYAVKA